MRRTKVVLGSVAALGALALGLATRELLSFQVDAAGLKGMAHAILSEKAVEHSLAPELCEKLTRIADLAIDSAAPHVVQLRADLDALARASDAGAASGSTPAASSPGASQGSGAAAATAGRTASVRATAELKSRLDDLERDLVGLVDVTDAVLAQARTRLAPEERAHLILTVATTFRERTGLTEASLEEVLSGLRSAHEARLTALLGLSGDAATQLKQTMEREAGLSRNQRHERWAALAELQAALKAGAAPGGLDAALARWDACGAKGSDLMRERIKAMRAVLTLDQQAKLALTARDRIGRVLRLVSLIQKFRPLL